MDSKIGQLVENMYPFCAERMYGILLTDYHYKHYNVPITTNLITFIMKKEILKVIEEKKDSIKDLILDDFDKETYDIGLDILLKLEYYFRNDQEITYMASEYQEIIDCRKMINKFFLDMNNEGFFKQQLPHNPQP